MSNFGMFFSSSEHQSLESLSSRPRKEMDHSDLVHFEEPSHTHHTIYIWEEMAAFGRTEVCQFSTVESRNIDMPSCSMFYYFLIQPSYHRSYNNPMFPLHCLFISMRPTFYTGLIMFKPMMY